VFGLKRYKWSFIPSPPPKKKEIIEKKRNRIRKIRDERRIRKKGKNKNGSFSFILPGGDG
jgi:hypothetical protein